jgi:hypothetical protein
MLAHPERMLAAVKSAEAINQNRDLPVRRLGFSEVTVLSARLVFIRAL